MTDRRPFYVAVRSRRTGEGRTVTRLFVDDDPAQARADAEEWAATLRHDLDVEELTVTESSGGDET